MADTERSYGKWRSFSKKLHGLVTAIEPWGILVAASALVLAVAQFWVDYQDRVNQRVVSAWTLVTTSAPGNSGKREALEYLNREDGLCFEWLWGGCALVLKSRTMLVGIDLSDSRSGGGSVYLQEVNLSGANLSEANLSGANLLRANLTGANLSEANLSGANLLRANLLKTNLLKADLSGADLSGADLTGANLLKANLFGANLSGADLFGANLSRADLTGANLTRANLLGANLSGAHFLGANLLKADLTGANLSQANFFEANLSEANLSGANLSGAHQLSQVQLNAACAAPNDPRSMLSPLKWNKRKCAVR